jgi:hypothetical protein
MMERKKIKKEKKREGKIIKKEVNKNEVEDSKWMKT